MRGAKKRRLFHTKHEGERLAIYHQLSSHLLSSKHSSPAAAENVPARDAALLIHALLLYGDRDETNHEYEVPYIALLDWIPTAAGSPAAILAGPVPPR